MNEINVYVKNSAELKKDICDFSEPEILDISGII